ncbi:MAG: rubrerythrin family protein [Oscillospiraceae bacterium]|nr:rubrerythrin family protein [Oscillospiraceae bacterium]
MNLDHVRAPGPYPPVQVQGKNRQYAALMLSNIGSANSELSAVAHYRYVHVDCDGDLAQLAHELSVVEMQHLDDFARLAKLLGEEPRFWQCCGNRKAYWSPSYVDYTYRSTQDLLQKLIAEEKAAIRKYAAQAARIGDPFVVAVLNRVIADEEVHVRLLEDVLKGV